MNRFKIGHEYRFTPPYLKAGQYVIGEYVGLADTKIGCTMHMFKLHNSGCLVAFSENQVIGEVFEEA